MAFFAVDEKKCSRDGICAASCPIRIIRMGAPGPSLVEWGEKACIKCGHCVAACPNGAISLDGIPVSACRALPAGWNLTAEKVETLLKGRRSIRVYKDEPAGRATIEKLIDIARYAPSGINRQPVRWAVVFDTVKVKRLAELTVDWMRSLIKENAPIAEALHMGNIVKAWEDGSDPIFRGAPHVIMVYSLKDDMTAPAACTIALTYFELAAASHGLGTCWAGYAQMAVNASRDAQKLAGISSRAVCHGAMMLGYPKFRYSRIPSRNEPHILWR